MVVWQLGLLRLVRTAPMASGSYGSVWRAMEVMGATAAMAAWALSVGSKCGMPRVQLWLLWFVRFLRQLRCLLWQFRFVGSYGSRAATVVRVRRAATGGVMYGTPVETECDGCSPSTTTDDALMSSGSAVIDVSVPVDAKFMSTISHNQHGYYAELCFQQLAAWSELSLQLPGGVRARRRNRRQDGIGEAECWRPCDLSFGAEDELALNSATDPVTTELKLTVPENAKVFLAGAETDQRARFVPSRRTAWLRVKHGMVTPCESRSSTTAKTIVQEESLNIKAGETYELAFDFDNETDHLAAK